MRAQRQQPLQHDLDCAHLRFGHALRPRGDGILGGDIDRDFGDLVEAIGALGIDREEAEDREERQR